MFNWFKRKPKRIDIHVHVHVDGVVRLEGCAGSVGMTKGPSGEVNRPSGTLADSPVKDPLQVAAEAIDLSNVDVPEVDFGDEGGQ